MPALADAMTGEGERAQSHRATAAALVDSLSDDDLSLRLDAAAWLAAAELYLDLYAEADAHADRALTLARATGQGELFLVLVQILGRAWFVRGKLAPATELLDRAIEASRLSGNTQSLVGNLFNRSVVAVATGDLDIAVRTAQESVDLARHLEEGFVTAWAAVRLAGALLEIGHPQSAVELILSSAGGEELTLIPGSWRAYCLELLTRCWLALDRHAEDMEAPIEAALSRTLAGRALTQAGQRDHAIAELERAAEDLDACGALRYRDDAERELGQLGHRTHRRTRPGKTDGTTIESLTERELQVARLVVDRKTNRQIAADLFLSQKTIETHLHNIFRKVAVSSRVELARAVERADLTARATPN